jgi:hypothetical protein
MKWLATLMLPAALQAGTYYVTISGLGGDAEYEQRFVTQAKEMETLIGDSGEVITLNGVQAKKADIQKALADVAAKATPDDVFVLTLIGHGTFDGDMYKFNIPGPDLTAVELAAWCDKIPAKRQLVVNMTSSSGGSVGSLQKEQRVVIAATRSGTERNATVFSRYWADALRDPATDTDKNEVVSALEAFRSADRRTTDFYQTQKRLATEHSIIEDTGKGEGVRDPSPGNGQGLLAAAFPVLRLGAAQRAAADPGKKKLMDEKELLEQRIDRLKYEKAAMPTRDYRTQLTTLLLQLAKVQEELDK